MSENIIEELFTKPKEALKRNKNKPINIFASLFFITLGLVFLLNNLGILPWGMWIILWRFWPIFLIMAGLQILAGRSWMVSVIIFGLGLGLITTVILYSVSLTNLKTAEFIDQRLKFIPKLREYLPTNPGGLYKNVHIVRSSEFENVEKVVINLDLGAGRFSLSDADENYHVRIDASYYDNYGQPLITTDNQNGELIINIRSDGNTTSLLGGVEELYYDISLGIPEIPKDIHIKVGAGSMETKLSNTKTQVFASTLGAGKLTIVFERESMPKRSIDLKVGAGSMNVLLPTNSFAKFNYKIGVGALKINNSTYRGAGEYTIPNFSITESPLPVNVDVGVGTIVIRY